MSNPVMGKLMSSIKNDKNNTFGKPLGERVMHPTGFTLFDYKNAQYSTKNGEPIFHRGLDSGKITTIIGKAGTGKSSLAIQMAQGITTPYENGSVFFIDFEAGTEKERVVSITGMEEEEFDQKWVILQTGISTESVFALIKEIAKFKKENRENLLTENPNGVEILPPTVVIVDSIATMIPAKLAEGEDIAGNMAATQMARMNTQLFKRIAQDCISQNIMPIFINHINDKVETNSFIPTQTMINYGLRQTETLAGRRFIACLYRNI